MLNFRLIFLIKTHELSLKYERFVLPKFSSKIFSNLAIYTLLFLNNRFHCSGFSTKSERASPERDNAVALKQIV